MNDSPRELPRSSFPYRSFEFSGDFQCPFCGNGWYGPNANSDQDDPTLLIQPCAHLIYIFELTSSPSFQYVRSDFAGEFIQRLVKSNTYVERLKVWGTYRLKNAALAQFVAGDVKGPAGDNAPEWALSLGEEVARFCSTVPAIMFPEILPAESQLFFTTYHDGTLHFAASEDKDPISFLLP